MMKRRVRLKPKKPLVLLHLGAEYNAGNGATQSMNSLMKIYRRNPCDPRLKYPKYFARVEAQEQVVQRCRSTKVPIRTFYDDVSLVPAGGSQTKEPKYSQNVELTKHQLVQNILQDYHQPDVIIVAGLTQAYPAFKSIIWPLLKPRLTDPVLILGMRNPSANAHREEGVTDPMWLERYEVSTMPCSLPVAKTQAFKMGLQNGAFYWKPDII